MIVCIHHNDFDGICAAAIVAKFYKDKTVGFIETDYRLPLPKDDAIKDNDIIIVDFSFKPDDMQHIIDIAHSVVWIDHHATAKEYPYQKLCGLRNFNDKEEAGCELTWKYYFPDEKMPDAVKLIGDYDKWALKLQPQCFQFYEGLKVTPGTNSPLSVIWKWLFIDCEVGNTISHGKIVIQYRDNYCSKLCKSFGYETEIDGVRAYACNQYMFGSQGFGELFDKYPLCLAYIHDGEKFTVSLYSITVDVSVIAKNHGGGGHKGAAGFVCNELPWRRTNA